MAGLSSDTGLITVLLHHITLLCFTERDITERYFFNDSSCLIKSSAIREGSTNFQ